MVAQFSTGILAHFSISIYIQRGKELIESVTNPEVKKGMKEALSQLQSSLEKVQRQEKGLKKGFF